jgi:hypothetical protein
VKTSFLLLAPLEVGAMRLSGPLEFGAMRLSEWLEISWLGSAEEAARQRREQLRALEEGRRWKQQAAATSCKIYSMNSRYSLDPTSETDPAE